MKKIGLVLLLVAWFVSGCSGEQDASSDGEEKITLRLAWWGAQPRHEYTQKVIEMYEKAHPNIDIQAEYANWDDYWKKLAPMAAAHQLPDIIQMDSAYLAQYALKGQLEDLTPYIQKDLINVDSINENSLMGGKIDNKLYGFNLGNNAMTVIMNESLLRKAGVDTPKDNWTWKNFEDITLKVNQKLDIFGTNGMNPPDVFLPYYLRTNGQHMYSSDGKSLGYTDDSLFTEYFERQLKLVEAGTFPTPDVTAQVKGIEDELIITGKAPMTWQWSNQFVSFSEVSKQPLTLHLPPGPGQDKGMFLKPSMFFSIAKNSKHKEEAAEFINFFINDIEANKLIKGERGVPVSSKVAEGIRSDLSPEQKKVFDYVKLVEKIGSPPSPPDPMGAPEVMKALKDISEKILFKEITPEDGAKMFRKQANEILSRSR